VTSTPIVRLRRLLLLAGLSITCLAASRPAEATAPHTRADFDADGVLDTAVLRDTATSTQIEVRLSRSGARVFLSPSVPVRDLRSVDVTGDGLADLVADSPRGLQTWVYAGRRMLPAEHAAAIATLPPRTLAAPVEREDPDSTACSDDDPRAPAIQTSAPIVATRSARGHVPRARSLAAARPSDTLAPPRAPPAA